MDVEWPDRRADVLAALDCLASAPPELSGDEADPRWADLTNAVHWLVDDTWWDQRDPRADIGLILANESEADATRAVVALHDRPAWPALARARLVPLGDGGCGSLAVSAAPWPPRPYRGAPWM